jgi:hypothetical protein
MKVFGSCAGATNDDALVPLDNASFRLTRVYSLLDSCFPPSLVFPGQSIELLLGRVLNTTYQWRLLCSLRAEDNG